MWVNMKKAIAGICRYCSFVTLYLGIFNGRMSLETFLSWAFLGFLIIFVIPAFVLWVTGLQDKYDGYFEIDESEPTDVKLKMVMNTPSEKITDLSELRIQIRCENNAHNGGVNYEN